MSDEIDDYDPVKRDLCERLADLQQRCELAESTAERHQQMVNAWLRVCELLDKLEPNWQMRGGNAGLEAALTTIQRLAALEAGREVIYYEYRFLSADSPPEWSEWYRCGKDKHDEIKLNSERLWRMEARALYTTPQPAPVQVVPDSVQLQALADDMCDEVEIDGADGAVRYMFTPDDIVDFARALLNVTPQPVPSCDGVVVDDEAIAEAEAEFNAGNAAEKPAPVQEKDNGKVLIEVEVPETYNSVFRVGLDADGALRFCDFPARLIQPAPVQAVPDTQAATDVLAERSRQISVEGWTSAHDDKYSGCELAAAAACYAVCANRDNLSALSVYGAPLWPWPLHWWKPTGYRRNLVKAGALILAEIERLDRAAPSPTSSGDSK